MNVQRHRMNRWLWISLILVVFLAGFRCGRDESSNRVVVARVGDRIIDADYLKRSLHLDPKWGRGLTWREAYLNQLDFLIDQKLFALAAESEHLNQDSALSAHLEFIRDKELIKELYRQEVESKIQITDEEYAAAYLKMKKRVKFQYIFTPDSARAWQYYERWKATDFDQLPLENPQVDNKGVTPMFSYGEMEEPLEEVLFDLQMGELAPPIKISDGYMVVRLLYGEEEKFQSELDLAEKKNKIRKVIFERRASRISNRYIKNLMQDKDLTLNPPVFFALAQEFGRIIENKISDKPEAIFVSNRELNLANRSLNDFKNQTLITYRDGEMTVGEFLKRLSRMPEHLRPNLKHPRQLKNAIGVVVRDEYLVREAQKRGLDRSPRARREIRIQQDELLARYWLKKHQPKRVVGSDEIQAFRQQEKYSVLVKKFGRELQDEEIAGIIRSREIAEFKLHASDSLKPIYSVQVDSSQLMGIIKRPDEVIDYHPAPVIIREIYH